MIWGQPNSQFQECFQGFFFSFSNLQLQVLRFLLTSQDFWKHSTYIITVYICMTYKLYILCTCSEGKNTTIFAAWWCWWETKVCNKGILIQQYQKNRPKSCFHGNFCKKKCAIKNLCFLIFKPWIWYKYLCKVKSSYLYFSNLVSICSILPQLWWLIFSWPHTPLTQFEGIRSQNRYEGKTKRSYVWKM